MRFPLSVMVALALTGAEASVGRKVIAFGWEFGAALTPDVLLHHADRFAETGLDGIGIYNTATTATGLPLKNLIHDPEWKREHFIGQIPIFRRATAKPGLTHCFFKALHSPKTRVSWTNDVLWAKVGRSMRTAAWFAKECGFKGLCVDFEDYHNAFQFTRRPMDPEYDDLEKIVRRRGRETFAGAFEEFPDMVVISYWLLSMERSYFSATDPVGVKRDAEDLWPAFFNGILDVLSDRALLVDGNEHAYRYKADDGDFALSSVRVRERVLPLVAPENRAKYRAQVSVSFGLYMDMYVAPEKDASGKPSKWYMPPADGSRLGMFDRNLNAAAFCAGDYVWLWGEKHSWISWDGRKSGSVDFAKTWNDCLPGLHDVIRCAKDPDAFAIARVSELKRDGKLVNLAAKTPVGTWQNSVSSHGIFMETNGIHRAEGVAKGCFTARADNVRPGEGYLVTVASKGALSTLSVGWQKDREWLHAMPNVSIASGKPGPGGWRRAAGFVRVPNGVDRIILTAGVHHEEGEVTEFKDFGIFRVK